MSTINFNKSNNSTKPVCAAKDLSSDARQKIGVQAAAEVTPISRLARENGTSRKFIYSQKAIATQAVEGAFQESDESDVLFYLPVTKNWIQQFVISLILICNCSYRGVVELLRDLFDYHISVGSVHNVAQNAVERVRHLLRREDLSRIRVGAPDEIFQGGKPVLAACDVDSLYCYLLAQSEHRDGDTWAIHLLDCIDKGLNVDYTIADFGKGLRAGQMQAMPGVPCLGDHFHVLHDMGKAYIYLENRAYRTIKTVDDLERKMMQAKKKGRGNKFSKKLAAAREECAAAVNLADDYRTLAEWMRELLSPVGPDFQTRQEMFDFIVEELQKMEDERGKHRIIPVRRLLENNKSEILQFAKLIDEEWAVLAQELGVDDYLIRKMYELQSMPADDSKRYELEQLLRKRLRGKFHFVHETVSQTELSVRRASSAIENFNSRLRNYFFLRKQLGSSYLELLRFFLNQRRFLASEDPRRSGKSPAEIMLGTEQPHWLEQLGYQLFKRAA